MRVAFHSDALAGRVHYGLGRYARELSAALQRLEPTLELLPFALRDKSSAPRHFNSRLCIGSWALLDAPKIEHWTPQAELVHSVELDYPVATRRPWVVTVHDLGPLTHPQFFSKSRPWLRRRALRQALDKAAIIVAVSGATAAALEHAAGESLNGRLRIVPEGVNKRFFDEQSRDCLTVLRDLPAPGIPYFLWTGSLNPRKNLANVVRAFEKAAPTIPHHLVLAGGLGWDNGIVLSGIETSPFRRRIHRPGYVTDEQLRALYQGADAFIYVSLMEGFGLPILEAMASGCPVIASNISSMPEVAGDVGVLVDPLEPGEIATAMRCLATDESLRKSLRHCGRARARQFSWEKCAAQMLEIYRDAGSP